MCWALMVTVGIVGMVTLPYKNATAIYNTLMRPLFKTVDVAMDHTVMRKWVLQK